MIKKVVDTITMKDINTATLTGCVDIAVCERKDSSLASTPFHVRFGKLKVLRTHCKSLMIILNDVDTGLKMKLGPAGEGYFEYEVDESEAAEEFQPEDEEEETQDSKKDGSPDKSGNWFWGKFPSKYPQNEREEVQGVPHDKEPPSASKKKPGLIRRIGNFFSRSKGGAKKENETPEKQQSLIQESDDPADPTVRKVKSQSAAPTNSLPEEVAPEDYQNELQRLEASEDLEEYQKDQVALSLCKLEVSEDLNDHEVVKIFMKNKIRYEDYKDSAAEILRHPNLLIKIQDALYNPEDGIPQIISLLAFGKTIAGKIQKEAKEPALEEPETQSVQTGAEETLHLVKKVQEKTK